MNKNFKLLISLVILCSYSYVYAQSYTVNGVVSDAASGEKLIGASVLIKDLGIGASTDVDGKYSIENVREGIYEVVVSYVGYTTLTKNVKIEKNLKLDFSLDASSVLLTETVVKSSRAVLRETPVAFSEVKAEELEFKLASRDVPMELEETPSVYATPSGGGAGDANLFVRGFNQRNISIMVNGVPVNDMETKWVYWSNWAGLGDVIDVMQAQRGLGASPYSVNAVGGLINMTTKGVGYEQEFIKVRSEFGSNNLFKSSVSFHKKISSKLSATAFVSRRTWDGYASGTYADDWTYFFSVGGIFGNHTIEVTGVGTPQEHGQRPLQLYLTSTNPATQTWEKRGHLYNANVGILNGRTFNDRINSFHKPQFNVNWNWQIDNNSTLSTVAYLSFGRGYGSSALGTYATYRASDGLEDYDAVWANNTSTAAINKSVDASLHSSKTILVNSVNNHNWVGLLSTYTNKLSATFTFTGGIDARYYKGIHYQEVRDLLGGDYYLDNTDNTYSNPNTALGHMKMTHVGDRVGYYNDNLVKQFGGFGQVEYKAGNFTSFINLSASSTGNQRTDYFRYLESDPMRTTDWQNFFGYTAKTGARYNLDAYNSIFGNIGYFSTAPLPNTIFTKNTNVVSLGAVNEKVLGVELGYEIISSVITMNAHGFYTNWKDRAMVPYAVTNSVTDPVTGQQYFTTSYVNVVGANELHYGAELEMIAKPFRKLTVKANASVINARYTNDVDAAVWPENDPTRITPIKIYSQDLFVSEFPQQQATLSLDYGIYLGGGINMYLNPVYKFFGRHFAKFYVDDRQNASDREQPWRIPDYNITDMHIGFSLYLTDFFVKKINLNLHAFNIFNNQDYVIEGTDGPSTSKYGMAHTAESAKAFFGQERWFNVGLVFNF